ncbi:MAG: 50S ribosomal protein L24 [Candidatus Omnitrophota bacterium]|nr:50S ribosomal protein L24 [Candidatus Omnitrophota bacterium]MDZ4242913.1 50S ribosomal protein L24 [Candidatus Omnitrophota bacterium]
MRIKKNDRVMVITGKDKGKIGKVIRVISAEDRVVIEAVNMIKKAKRRTQQDQQGGFLEVERPIHISNVMLVDKKTNKPTRFSVSVLKDGSKVRISKKSGEAV